MARDGKPDIRIDDPNSLIKIGNESKIQNMCRYCGKENAKSVCGRCDRAQYCDKICQMIEIFIDMSLRQNYLIIICQIFKYCLS